MTSRSLIPTLSEMPTGDREHKNTREAMKDLLSTEPDLSASEFAAAVSIGIWGIWDRVNVSDQLAESYAAQYPNLAAEHSLHEQWESIQDRGPEAVTGFVAGLKGKLAEVRAVELLEEKQFTDVQIAASPVQAGWDISAVNPDGEEVFFQVKTGTADYGRSVAADIENSGNIDFLLGSEVHGQVASSAADQIARITDIGSDFELVAGVSDGLETLSANEGIDVPDGLGDLLPYASGLMLAWRWIREALDAELEFTDVARTTQNKMHVVRALTLISRHGITAVLAAIGGVTGVALGSVVPFIGNLIGGLLGALGVPWMFAANLNKQIQPHILDLALSVTGLTDEDLFYFKNKKRIVQLGESFRQAADGLDATTP